VEDYAYVVDVDGAVVRDGEYRFVERGADESHAAASLAFPGGKLECPPGGEGALGRTIERELAAVRWLAPASLAERERVPDDLRRGVERIERVRGSRSA
jgi:8-oxo-dGTP diphosphatase